MSDGAWFANGPRVRSFVARLEQLVGMRASSTDGSLRIRAELRGLYGNPSQAPRVEARLRALPGVVPVRANPRTGRVLVTLFEGSAELRAQLFDTVRALSNDQAKTPPSFERALE